MQEPRRPAEVAYEHARITQPREDLRRGARRPEEQEVRLAREDLETALV